MAELSNILCYSHQQFILISAGLQIGISAYNKMRLTGGLNLTEKNGIYLDNELKEKILSFEKEANINYERFR